MWQGPSPVRIQGYPLMVDSGNPEAQCISEGTVSEDPVHRAMDCLTLRGPSCTTSSLVALLGGLWSDRHNPGSRVQVPRSPGGRVLAGASELKLIIETYPLYLKLKRKESGKGNVKGKQSLGTSEMVPWWGGAQAAGKGPRNFCAQSPIQWGWVLVPVKNRKHPKRYQKETAYSFKAHSPLWNVLWRMMYSWIYWFREKTSAYL